jgi:uncharacterized protein (DUF1501 family)
MLGSGAALASIGINTLADRPTLAASSPSDKTLIVVFLRGGCDGLNLVAPVDDANYQAARGADLRIQESGDRPGLPLQNAPTDQDFRLHPAAPELKEIYDSGQLAIVHACGLTNGTRSHFEATDLMERGTEKDKGLNSGWITRYLGSL